MPQTLNAPRRQRGEAAAKGFERLSGVLARRRDGAPLVVLLADGHVDAKAQLLRSRNTLKPNYCDLAIL